MERILQAFRRSERRALLIPFLMAGDPTFDLSVSLFNQVLSSGADIVEIGIPYSDPLADGPVIQASALRSLQSGFSLPRVFELTAKLRRQTNKALVLFTYVNPVMQYGFKEFFQQAKVSGADGVIIPDLPFEESEVVRAYADEADIALIPLIAPTSNEERIERICSQARGFVYCVSSLGVTGERSKMSDRLQNLVASIKKYTDLPVAVGFGVSTPEQANAIAEYANGVIVGSAYIRRIEQTLQGATASPDYVIEAVAQFTEQLARAAR